MIINCYICGKNISKEAHYNLHPNCFKLTFKVKELCELLEFRRLKTDEEGSFDDIQDSSRDAQFHGHYPKYSARLKENRYIIKTGTSDKYPLLAEAEALSNRIAELLKLPIAKPFALIEYKEKKCFIVKDFTQSNSPQNLIHLFDIWPKFKKNKLPFHLETLIQLLKDTVSYQELCACLELLLFDYLIGNGDRHRGNIAVIQKGKEKIKLAPFYDNVTDLGIEAPSFLDPSMKWHPGTRIQLKNGKTAIQDYLSVISLAGFSEVIHRFQRKLNKQLTKIVTEVQIIPVNRNLQACLLDLMQRRSKELIQWK